MKKKILALCLCIALAATAIVGASLAYFTDTDAKENTFTSGNVKIQLNEKQRGEGDALVDFEQNKVLIPYTGDEKTLDLEKNYVDKMVSVTNNGTQPAYVRVLVAVPHALKDVLHLKLAMGVSEETSNIWGNPMALEHTTGMIDGVNHDIYVLYYRDVLAAGETTKGYAMHGMYLDSKVDCDKDGNYTLDGMPIDADLTNVTIPVFAQAVQSQGFDSAADAFAKAEMPTNPWAKTAA